MIEALALLTCLAGIAPILARAWIPLLAHARAQVRPCATCDHDIAVVLTTTTDPLCPHHRAQAARITYLEHLVLDDDMRPAGLIQSDTVWK